MAANDSLALAPPETPISRATGRPAISLRARVIAATAAAVAANLPFMYYRMFSSFARYDDEGYLLLAVRDFIGGRRLYTDIFSPYGPFYFLYKFASYAGGALPVTHDLNRLFTIAEWAIAAGLAGILGFALTRSVWAAGTTALLSAGSVAALANEPGHPQGLLLVLVAAFLLSAVYAARGDGAARWMIPGAIVAAITLTKLNVGVFAGLALGLALLRGMRTSRARNAALAFLSLAAAVLPVALMLPHLRTWAAPFCAVASATIVAALFATMRTDDAAERSVAGLVFAVAGALILSAITIAFTIARGTPPGEFVRGWIITPTKIAGAFWTAPPITIAAICSAILALVVAAAATTPAFRLRFERTIQILKILFAVCVLAGSALFIDDNAWSGALLGFALPFGWLAAVPLQEQRWSPTEAITRRLLVLTAVLHMLVAYPIAGSQLQMATFLCVLLAVLCAADSVAPTAIPLRRRIIAGVAIAALFCAPAATKTIAAGRAYRSQTPLNLPGASRIRLPHEEAAEYQWVVANLRAHAETFVSLPGLNSLYFWTGERPPTATNVTTWMTLLDDGQQRSIARSLLSHDRACAVVTDYSFWTRGQDLARAPLFRTLQDDFIPTPLTTGTFTILDRRRARPRSLDNYLLFDSREFARDDDRMAAPLPALQRERLSLEARFRTTRDGTILSVADRLSGTPTLYLPMVYVGSDGRVYAQARWGRPQPLRSRLRVDDGRWHHVVLKIEPQRDTLYLDGRLENGSPGRERALRQGLHAVIGSGYTAGFPSAPDGWFPFRGTIASVIAN